jgi:hypothetical protein
VTVIRGTWAFQGTTGADGPLAEGTGSTGGSGTVTLKHVPIDRYSPSRLRFTGPIDGTASISEHVSLVKGTSTELGGCGGSLVGQDEGFGYMTVVLDLDDGTYSVDLSGTVKGCSKVTGQDVSYEANEAAFTVTAPHATGSAPQIPRDGLYLSLSSSALVVACHGLPLVGEGRLIVQLGRIPDGWNRTIKRKAQKDLKKTKEPPKKEPPKEESPNEKPPKEEEDPNVLHVKALTTLMQTEPDFLSDGVRVLPRGTEVIVLDEKGRWYEVVDRKSGDVGWINRAATIEETVNLSEPLDAKLESVSAKEVEIAGRG